VSPVLKDSKAKMHYREMRFFIIFIFLFFVFQALHYAVRPYIAPFVIHTLTTGGSSRLINLITPSEKTAPQKEYLASGNFKIKIARGCEGIEGIIILAAAILAFPAGIKPKLIGLAGGVFAIYFFNLIRVAGLYYTLKYKPALFDMMHMYVGQTFIILIAFLYFIAWLNIQMGFNEKHG
jgi:exosortase family protein XrtM